MVVYFPDEKIGSFGHHRTEKALSSFFFGGGGLLGEIRGPEKSLTTPRHLNGGRNDPALGH